MPEDPRPGPGPASAPVELAAVESFESLFRREYPRLVGVAWGLTGSREAAEDVVQDVMLTLYRKWEGLPPIANPQAYLRRATVNRATSAIRRAATEARALLRVGSSMTDGSTTDHDTETFWSAVRRLPRRQAQVVALYYECDMSVEQVADALEVAPGTIKSHLSRARAAIADQLSLTDESHGGRAR